MTPAQRMVRASRWMWLPGMLRNDGSRLVGDCEAVRWHDDGDGEEAYFANGRSAPRPDGIAPDLTDPATLGAIEHGLLGPAGWWVERDRAPSFRAWPRGNDAPCRWRHTLAEALADAVEALG